MAEQVRDNHVPRRVLVTGGAGFIGSNLVRHLLVTDRALRIVVLDALTYAGNRGNLAAIERDQPERYRFVHGDICDRPLVDRLFSEEAIDTVIHLAAESHVDRSIDAPAVFLRTNVEGTMILLQAARQAWGNRDGVRFHHVSTDEVYGSLGATGAFSEDSPYDPSSPYSASKAASDHLVRAWHHTFGLPVTISNCSNNYGPYQFPEKLIPLMIAKALAGEPLPVYGDGGNVRDWLHVDDHCRALDRIVRAGRSGRTYNVGGQGERSNLDLVRALCATLDRERPTAAPHDRLITFVPDRPGHDRRYAIDAARIARELSWRPAVALDQGLAATVRWYLDCGDWMPGATIDREGTRRRGLTVPPTP